MTNLLVNASVYEKALADGKFVYYLIQYPITRNSMDESNRVSNSGPDAHMKRTNELSTLTQLRKHASLT
jgi:hypothetical protein